MLLIVIEDKWDVEVKLMPLELVSCTEPKRQLDIVIEGITTSDVKLIDKSFSLGIAHVKRIEYRADSKIAFVFLTKVLLDAV